MTGMDRSTGGGLNEETHLRQSITDILTTPIGGRVARRDYGSLLPDLIDQPVTAATGLRLYAATALALSRWEKRLRLTRITMTSGSRAGAIILILEGQRTDTAPANSRTRLTIPLSRAIA
ncbi:GPW/gp25 family protein [Govanella unica]|uniref:GPW/gp25 family protein n=1 Tax=Govanella unica TaxID=2975056 RepID=A0A9X3TW63_9PROT|nr:GPW/gp25 family protein [Govania unica]MDA5192792.1 GPW/gp25 family protein [Govania unica]